MSLAYRAARRDAFKVPGPHCPRHEWRARRGSVFRDSEPILREGNRLFCLNTDAQGEDRASVVVLRGIGSFGSLGWPHVGYQ